MYIINHYQNKIKQNKTKKNNNNKTKKKKEKKKKEQLHSYEFSEKVNQETKC